MGRGQTKVSKKDLSPFRCQIFKKCATTSSSDGRKRWEEEINKPKREREVEKLRGEVRPAEITRPLPYLRYIIKL